MTHGVDCRLACCKAPTPGIEWEPPPLPASDLPVPRWFTLLAERWPNRTAVQSGPATLTYRGLEQRANRLARTLISAGASQERVIGIYLDRRAEAAVPLLAAWKAGAVAMPLDTAHPPERIARLLQVADARLVVTTPQLAQTLPPRWQDSWLTAGSGTGRLTPPTSTVAVTSLACLFSTSGSTGVPKLVGLDHTNLVTIVAAQATLQIPAGARVLEFASFGYDGWLWVLLLAFQAGATACIHRRKPGDGLAGLANTLAREAVTVAVLPPAVLELLEPRDVPLLSTVFSAGDACPVALAQRWGCGRRLVNVYGPTEAAAVSVTGEVSGISGDTTTVPLGLSMPGSCVTVRDQDGRTVPAGHVGEITIAGNVARGYIGNPAATAGRFVPDRYGPPGTRAYRTGDRGRFAPNGWLEFHGREDHQVKIRGNRVELGEVEAALVSHPAVGAAAAVAVGKGPTDRVVVAFVALASATTASTADIRAHTARFLPPAAVPAHVAMLDELPLNLHGKVDRPALARLAEDERAREDARPDASEASPVEHASPDQVARIVATVCAEALGRDWVGLYEDFFALGGHSVSATIVHTRLCEMFDIELPVALVFEAPTVAAMAAKITELAGYVATDTVEYDL